MRDWRDARSRIQVCDEPSEYATVVSIVWVDSRVSREIRILYKWYSVLTTLPINNNATHP